MEFLIIYFYITVTIYIKNSNKMTTLKVILLFFKAIPVGCPRKLYSYQILIFEYHRNGDMGKKLGERIHDCFKAD